MASEVNEEVFQKLSDEIERLCAERQKMLKPLFEYRVKVLFDKHPDIARFRWNQYTPYFNDGDPCVFRLGLEECEVMLMRGDEGEGVEKDDDDCGDGDGDWIECPTCGEEGDASKAFADEVEEVFSDFEQADFEAMFGGHVRVEVSGKGILVEEYEHY